MFEYEIFQTILENLEDIRIRTGIRYHAHNTPQLLVWNEK